MDMAIGNVTNRNVTIYFNYIYDLKPNKLLNKMKKIIKEVVSQDLINRLKKIEKKLAQMSKLEKELQELGVELKICVDSRDS